MNLECISYIVCPTCGSIVISETKKNQHTNGYWNETRIFDCGCIVEYSPNFKNEHITVKCPNSQERILFQEKRKKAILKIKKYISNLDVDEKFKQQLSIKQILKCVS